MTDRYNFENLPISEKTKEGMKLSIDDVSILGRMMALQDDANDEEHEKIFKALDVILKKISATNDNVTELRKEVAELRAEVASVDKRVSQVTKVVDQTKEEVQYLSKEVVRLKKINSISYYIIRVAIAIAGSILFIRLMHGPFY